MNLKPIESQLAGRFRLEISGGKRGYIDHGWQDNLILDSGITRLLGTDGDVLTHVSVGSGTTAPAVGQTNLIARIKTTNRNRNVTNGYNQEQGYGWTKVEVQFNQGEAAGNIGELGIGWNTAGSLFSRALVLDTQNNPTVITVLADEYLIVTYELRRWWQVPEPHTLDINEGGSKIGETTITYNEPTYADNANGASGGNYRSNNFFHNSTNAGNNHTAKWVGLGEFEVKALTNQKNTTGFDAIIGSVYSGGTNDSMPFTGVFCTFDPPIPKTNEYEVTITGTLTITRR